MLFGGNTDRKRPRACACEFCAANAIRVIGEDAPRPTPRYVRNQTAAVKGFCDLGRLCEK
jgi:hypothetical protein